MSAALNILAARAVRRAIAAGGKVDPVEHFGDLLNLHRLAEAMGGKTLRERVDQLNQPVMVGKVRLYRLSFGAIDWLDAGPVQWFSDDRILGSLATAFAMAHSHQRRVLDRLADPTRTEREIRLWERGTGCAADALMEAVDALLERPDDGQRSEVRDQKSDDAELVSRHPVLHRLMHAYGGTIDYWLWEVSADDCVELLDQIRADQDAQTRATSNASGRAHAPDPASRAVRAHVAFNKAAQAFHEKIVPKTGEIR